MTIDGPGTVVGGVVVVFGCTIGLALLWDHTRILVRTTLVVAVVLSLTTASALELNRLTGTYSSWSELAGEQPAEEPEPEPMPATGPSTGAPVVLPGKGRLVTYRAPGPASGMNLPIHVYLPGAYFTPEGQNLDFPVIEALHGYPGSAQSWIRRLDIVAYLDREITAGRMAPTIVLLPQQTPRQLLDTECLNLVGGPQAETYLTRDVPAWARTHLRVRTDRAAWGLIGYSAGAFCAMNLVLKHPDQYAAAASLSGYPHPSVTVGDRSEESTNDIAWRLSHLPRPSVALWIGWADDDTDTRTGSRRIAALAKPPLSVVTAAVPHGGHSHAVWKQMEGPAFDWLSAHLARPAPRGRPAGA